MREIGYRDIAEVLGPEGTPWLAARVSHAARPMNA